MNKKPKTGKFYLLIIFSLVLHFSFYCSILSQEIPKDLHQWGAISSFHGLPSERVLAIAQTRDGLLWFGTERGLAKFDGRRVQTVSANNLSSLKILALNVADDGTLWIGTENGAFMMKGDDVSAIKETSASAINSILFGKNETYLSSEKGAIYKCASGEESSFREDKSLQTAKILSENFQITNLAFYENNLIASTLSRGLLLIGSDNVTEITTRPRPYFVNVLAKDKAGKIWLGTQTRGGESGLYSSENLFEPQRIGSGLGNVNAIAFDNENNAWVGTNNNGVFRFRGENLINNFTFFNTSGGLRSNEILTVFVDRENVVWLGTNKGICRYDMQSPNTERITDSSESNFIRTLFRASGGEILAGSNRGLFYFDISAGWTPVKGFENRAVYSIAQDAAENLLVGTSNGFFPNVKIQEGVTQPLKLANDETQNVIEDIRSMQNFQGKTYISVFNRGLARIENETTGLNFSDENLKNITVFHADRRLWFGTAKNGVFFLEGNKIVQEAAFEILRNNAVWEIEGTEESGLWFAAEKGLYLFQNGKLQTVLSNTQVRDVRSIPETNAVWAATSNGVVVIRNDAEFGWITSRLSVEQGLPSANIFTILPPVENFQTLLIGTNRGAARYNLSRIPPLLVPTRILSRRVHQTDELAGGINLEFPQNSLALEVAALSSRTFPEQFQYAFILRGETGEIVNKKFSNDAQFLMENLKPGTYSVEARAFDKNLVASEPLTFQFSVAKSPFPWSTLLLSSLLAIALIALAWAIISQRRIFRTSKELKFANRELSSARLDLANEAERERRRISRDLHDQTLADLRHLILLADKFQHDAENSNRFRTEIENVSQEIRRICEDLSPSVLENIGLTAALEWALSNEVEMSEADKKFNYEFSAEDHLDERLKLAPAVQIQIYRIAQEVLNNISRHANASNVNMSVKINESSRFQMIIEDDGNGFDSRKKLNKKGRGLSNINARASLIEAEVEWKPNENGGTIFTLEK